ncbi:MAG: hypothetical protein IKQ45_05320 [Clostridia bacterium]|nr:hypothetical protein [Clostridia bacterium]
MNQPRKELHLTARLICLLLALLLAIPAASADSSSGILETLLGDVDGDGKPDLITLYNDYSLTADAITSAGYTRMKLDEVQSAAAYLLAGNMLKEKSPGDATMCFLKAYTLNPTKETQEALLADYRQQEGSQQGIPGEQDEDDDDEDDEDDYDDDEEEDDEDEEDGEEADTVKDIGGKGAEDTPEEDDEEEDEEDEEEDDISSKTITETKTSRKIDPGYHFRFGSFEQDTFTANGKEPIIWRVLDVDEAGGKALVLSEYGLQAMRYNSRNEPTKWKDADVQRWLNNDFMGSFTPEEREWIVPTTVSGSKDKAFLLDADQIRKYLSSPYQCFATPWAIYHDPDHPADVHPDTGASSWLVRRDKTESRITFVGGSGKLYVPEEGSKMKDTMKTQNNVVRPAMWVRLEAIGEEVTDYSLPLFAMPLTAKLPTCSGPANEYLTVGEYETNGKPVHVISKAHDGNIVLWIQYEYEKSGKMVRCYAGSQRFDFDTGRLPEDPKKALGKGTVLSVDTVHLGPGTQYREAKFPPTVGMKGAIIFEEDGWYCLEYTVERKGEKHPVRAWLPKDAVKVKK